MAKKKEEVKDEPFEGTRMPVGPLRVWRGLFWIEVEAHDRGEAEEVSKKKLEEFPDLKATLFKIEEG